MFDIKISKFLNKLFSFSILLLLRARYVIKEFAFGKKQSKTTTKK